MGIEDRDYYRDRGGASVGGHLTTCRQCGGSFAPTLWRMHAHNPEQARCGEAGCRERAVGYCAGEPFAGGFGPLCPEHVIRHRRRGHDVRFVDGGACPLCDGVGLGVGDGAAVGVEVGVAAAVGVAVDVGVGEGRAGESLQGNGVAVAVGAGDGSGVDVGAAAGVGVEVGAGEGGALSPCETT